MTPSPLDSLPVFASDRAIAEALVGKKDAPKWLSERLPALERVPGFPKIDALHGGRPVPLIKLFYDNYFALPANGKGLPDGKEDEGAWKKSKRPA
ncbi:hypothetical protein G6L78_01230 [Agrobacterium rhizogenes]|nr:hypothetical protein [Rhizobium rhizogenes]